MNIVTELRVGPLETSDADRVFVPEGGVAMHILLGSSVSSNSSRRQGLLEYARIAKQVSAVCFFTFFSFFELILLQ